MSKSTAAMKQTKSPPKISESSGSVPEFIQKLFRMLENDNFTDIFCWGKDGKTFTVKDTNEFSKTILPKHFKHCNFASFVRQLNKYDFHKVRNGEDGHKLHGEQAWEFIHPKFMRDRKDLLEEIKRKAPGSKQKKEVQMQKEREEQQQQQQQQQHHSTGSTPKQQQQQMADDATAVQEIKNLGLNLQLQIEELKQSRSALEENMNQLKQRDAHIVNELVNFNKSMAVKDNLVKNFLRVITETQKSTTTTTPTAAAAGMDSNQAQKLIDSYHRIARNNEEQMNKLNKVIHPSSPPMHKSIANIKQETNETASAAAAAAASMNAGSLIGSPLKTADGLAFVTLGRLSSNMSVRDNKPAIEIMAADQTPNFATALQQTSNTQKRRLSPMDNATSSSAATTTTTTTTNNNNTSNSSSSSSSSPVSWTVPPRILLVDDDSVYRDLSGKLLSVIGCTIDLAKDGVEALKKMGEERYDLILMDIVMPKMDGISATRSIRQYDALTPIISMTSNFTDNDIMQYIGSGMTDILPKPFSKRTLYQMLEKYCAHLKTIQRVTGLEPSTSLLDPAALNGLDLLPMVPPMAITESSSNNNNPPLSSSNSPSLTPQPQQQPQQQQPPPPPYSSIPPPSSSNNSTPASTPTAFPLAPYPYPVTMNSVPSSSDFSNSNHGEIPNVTFWPQQLPHQQDPPPAIIPNDGKFTWAVPTNISDTAQIFDPLSLNNSSNKRRRND